MDIHRYIGSIYEQIDGIQSISLKNSAGEEILSKSDPEGSEGQSLPPPKSSLTDVFIKQCQHTQLLTCNEKEPSKLETLVTYSKTLQLIQFNFKLDENILYFTVVAMQNAKTGVIIDLFKNEFIPSIQTLL